MKDFVRRLQWCLTSMYFSGAGVIGLIPAILLGSPVPISITLFLGMVVMFDQDKRPVEEGLIFKEKEPANS
ncbi:MAG: hypothetical protein ACPGO5_05395 [Patescibacteria group bacterium]